MTKISYQLGDDDNEEACISIEVDDLVAEGLDALARLEGRLARKASREVSFTDAKIDPERVPDDADADESCIRHVFRWLVGESTVWSGPQSLWLVDDAGKRLGCRLCGHLAKLPRWAACLNPECLRTGIDLEVVFERGTPMVESYDRKPTAKKKNRSRGLKAAAGKKGALKHPLLRT